MGPGHDTDTGPQHQQCAGPPHFAGASSQPGATFHGQQQGQQYQHYAGPPQHHYSYCQSRQYPHSFLNNEDYKINRKGMNELPVFNAEYAKYKNWKDKLTDHAAQDNANWKNLLRHCEGQVDHIEYEHLSCMSFGQSTGWDLSLDLWNFLSKKLGVDLYEKRITLAHGVEGNGFELWRRLYVDYEGGDEVVQNDGRTKLQNFPQISSMATMSAKLDDWQALMLKYGGDVGPTFRRTMLLKILPESTREDVLKNQDLTGTDSIIKWIRKQLVWQRSVDIVKRTHRPVAALSHEADMPAPGAGYDITVPPIAAITPELVEMVVAAVKGKGKGKARGGKENGKGAGSRERSASPRNTFPRGHCYHCNATDHSRTPNAKAGRVGCPAFAKLLKENGNKLPDNYKGAFEKHVEAEKKKRAASGKSVTALLQEQDSEDDSSDDDIQPLCGAVWQKVGPLPCCKPFASMPICELSTPTMNSFNSLADEDDMPNLVDTDDVASSLQGWAHSVRRSSDKKTKVSKTMMINNSDDQDKLERLLCSASKRHSAKTLQRIHEEAELDQLSQLIERPSPHPKHLERTVKRVWAMVDSGSFVTIANCGKHFGAEHQIRPSVASRAGVKYSDASGGDIPNRGEAIITHILDDGSELDIPFQDGNVQVPIMSVKDYVHVGSVVKFRKNGGVIRLPSGKRMVFQEKHGVYFFCLNIVVKDPEIPPPPLPHPEGRRSKKSGFIRPAP